MLNRLNDRLDKIDKRLERLDRNNAARFDQVNRSAVTNLEIILAAIDGLRTEVRDLKQGR